MPREFGVYPATTLSLRPAAFSKSVKTFAKKSPLGHTFGGKLLLPDGATKFFFFENKFYIYMDFICLQWLAAGILSGRNNGAFRCYVEFTVRAKTEFSNDIKKLCGH